MSDSLLRLTTDGVRPRERAEFWADLVSRHVTAIDIEPSGARLRGSIEARPIGDTLLGLARVSGSGLRAIHTSAHAERTGNHLYAVCVHLGGDTSIVSRGDTTVLQRGDMFITDSRRPFTLGLERPWRHLVMTMPCEALDLRGMSPGALAGRVIRGRPLARLWATHLAAGFSVGGDLSAEGEVLFARHSLEILTQLIDEVAGRQIGETHTHRSMVYVSACHLIATYCSDPTLTPARIARRVGVSTRTLARAFADREQTVMQRVYSERIVQAARRLQSPAWAQRSVTDIAVACGFSDLSHFGRLFAATLGTTPSRYRLAPPIGRPATV